MFDAPLESGPMDTPSLGAMLPPFVVERLDFYPCNRQPWLPEPELKIGVLMGKCLVPRYDRIEAHRLPDALLTL